MAAAVLAAWMVACTSSTKDESPAAKPPPEESAIGQQKAAASVIQPTALLRTSFTQTVLSNNRILIAGGTIEGSTGGTNQTELYVPNMTPNWRLSPSMQVGRYDHAAVLLADGRVLVTGGITTTGDWRSSELYDPTSGTWTATTPMNTPRARHTSTLLADGRVLVVGGDNTSSAQGLASAEVFDPATATWTAAAAPSFPYSGHSATRLPSGKVLLLGNRIQHELYDPTTNTWAASANSPGALGVGHSATLRNRSGVDEVVVLGAIWFNGAPTAVTYRYLAATNQWAASSGPTVPRKGHQAMLLSNGAVRVMGGVSLATGETLSLVERFNLNNTWFTEPALALPRREFRATPAGTTDRVLATGGWNIPTDGGTAVRQQTETYIGCTPITCDALGANCGTIPDNCGGTLSCGTCSGGQTCNLTNNRCESPCSPNQNACSGRCGTVWNGCGNVDCGTCPVECPVGKVYCCSACNSPGDCDTIC